MEPFIPPRFNLALHWGLDLSFPLLMKAAINLDGIDLSAEDRSLLRSLREERVIVLCNHPTTTEPPVIYHLGNIMGSRFHYMASRHLFDRAGGWMGKMLQGLGAFSVLPGSADRESIRTARSILSKQSGKLVVFPEGEPCSGENDVLMPFQAGAPQLAFWSYEDVRRQDPDADIILLGVFVKYTLSGDVSVELSTSITHLETRLGLVPGDRSLIRRLMHIGRVLLEDAEKSASLLPDGDWDYRIGRIRHSIMDRLADRFSIQGYPRDENAIDKLRFLLAILEMKKIEFPDPRLPEMSAADVLYASRECQKAYTFIVTQREYILAHPSAERLMEWIQHFEEYVLGSVRLRSRTARVHLTEPVGVSRFYPVYKKARRSGLADLNEWMRSRMEALLLECMKDTPPVIDSDELATIREQLHSA